MSPPLIIPASPTDQEPTGKSTLCLSHIRLTNMQLIKKCKISLIRRYMSENISQLLLLAHEFYKSQTCSG